MRRIKWLLVSATKIAFDVALMPPGSLN